MGKSGFRDGHRKSNVGEKRPSETNVEGDDQIETPGLKVLYEPSFVRN